MKTIILISIILSSHNSIAQQCLEDKTNYPVVGFSSGYNFTHKSLNTGLHFGYKLDKIYLSSDMIIPLTRSVFVPFIFTVNGGVNISQFQPFVSINYSTIGGEAEQLFKGTQDQFINGFKFGYGIRYYPLSVPLCLTIQKQGKEVIASLTLYKAL